MTARLLAKLEDCRLVPFSVLFSYHRVLANRRPGDRGRTAHRGPVMLFLV